MVMGNHGAAPASAPIASDALLGAKDALEEEERAIQIARKALANRQPAEVPEEVKGTVGLALSGGGIRSGTFCLGVVQALAAKGRLLQVDYLSTVSGGGYFGAFLSAWIARAGLEKVNDALPRVGEDEAPEVTWLRRYSNYLAPAVGIFSADTLTLVAIWLRNVLLNLVVLVAMLATVFLLPRVFLDPVAFAQDSLRTELGYASAWFGLFLLPLGIGLHFTPYFMNDPERDIRFMNGTAGVWLLAIAPAVLAALFGAISLFPDDRQMDGWTPYDMMSFGFSLLVVAFLIGSLLKAAFPKVLSGLSRSASLVIVPAYLLALCAGAILVVFFGSVIWPLGKIPAERAANVLTFGPPALLATFGLMGFVVVGITGRAFDERTREWWARMNAWVIMSGAAWLVIVALSFYAAPVLTWARDHLGTWWSSVAGAGWLGSLLAVLFGKQPSSTERASGKLKKIFLNLALTAVMAGLLVFVAAGTGWAIEAWKPLAAATSVDREQANAPAETQPSIEDRRERSMELRVEVDDGIVKLVPEDARPESLATHVGRSFQQQERIRQGCLRWPDGLDTPPIDFVGVYEPCERARSIDASLFALLLCVALALIFGSRVDVNRFSLANMYKNRLTRCYLGASTPKRTLHPFTGFDEHDDLKMSEAAQRPFHIVNAALNITQGRDLAWQDRKAASFTFTPLHCGFTLGKSMGDMAPRSERDPPIGGYRPTAQWARPIKSEEHFTLGAACAISGAAVSALRGMHSTPATSFIATFFNIRLGRWSPNPTKKSWRKPSPPLGFLHLFYELFGYSNEDSNFVYLSDGGHFDNTGIYELVRRKCSTIVAVDATQDFARGFGDLANVIRRCRVDFGVEFRFDLNALGLENEPKGGWRASGRKARGYVIGEVHYPGPDGGIGRFMLIKPTLVTIATAVDLFSYARESIGFPHQSTVDQFFSESQFESYRHLGFRMAEDCLRDPASAFRFELAQRF